MILAIKKTNLKTLEFETFVDVKSDYWQKKYVDTALELWLITDANDHFNPNSFISRSESLKISILFYIWEINLEYSSYYSDVSWDDWYAKYVEYSKQNNLLEIDSTNFEPNKFITRIEVIWVIYELSKK